ncbi:MAG: class I mannose-6-phosphate isomerase [Sphingobium sp.]
MMKLGTFAVEKPWGRTDLPAMFRADAGKRVGEIWFAPDDGSRQPLLVKYLFTSEALSVQVHPDDAQARESGLEGGKSECWYVLDAEPGAVIGMGVKKAVSREALRAASLDGSVEGMLDWVSVSSGDFFYIPAGTIHAIGAGLTLIEVQQNNDVTYRLYDYGRDRPLHLDEGIPVSDIQPYRPVATAPIKNGTRTLLDGSDQPFRLDMIARGAGEHSLPERQCWLIPVCGSGTIDGESWVPGECWQGTGGSLFLAEPSDILVASLP